MLAFAVAGCAPSVRVPDPVTTLPARFEIRAAPGAETLVLDRWWLTFNDLQLTALVQGALKGSTTARIALARLEQARASRALSRAGTLPSGSISASATEQGRESLWGTGISASGQESYSANFVPSWELDLFGRLAAIREQADVGSAAATYDFHAARLALAADVASSLFQARGIAVDLQNARETREITGQLARAARIGVERGLTSGQDLARLEADAASAAAEVTRLEGELQAAKRSLLILVGTPDAPTASLDVAAELEAPPELPGATPGILLARRPDVLSAGLALQSAILDTRIDRLALFPRFAIQPGLGLNANGAPGAGGTGFWSLAGNLTLPVLDRARLLAQFRLSEARGEEAVVNYERAVQTAFGEAENALVRLQAAKGRTQQLERAEERSRTAYEIATRGYRAGLTDLTTLLQTQRTWLQVRSARNQGRLAVLTGTVSAVRALGGGWSEDGMPDAVAPKSDGSQP
ncbi:transporter [Novosphingobium endophyticum]|uniref:Transporter n=1 Tax=Novosphingobium endophyticum TaxID=1955250 RepID=A0A916X4K6_9SPHN|nr:transporter [Novosphingobium endophyticum]